MKERLLKKIEDLSKEAAKLSQDREELYKSIEQVNIRLHQIIGAIRELDQLVKESEGE